MAKNLGLTISYTFLRRGTVISYFLVQKLVHETRGVELSRCGSLKIASRDDGNFERRNRQSLGAE